MKNKVHDEQLRLTVWQLKLGERNFCLRRGYRPWGGNAPRWLAGSRRGHRDLFDHVRVYANAEGRPVVVSQPYVAEEERNVAVARIRALASRMGLHFRVSEQSWWSGPMKTILIELWKKEDLTCRDS